MNQVKPNQKWLFVATGKFEYNLDNASIHTTHRHVHKKVKKVKLEERRRPGDQVEDKTHHEHDENDDGLREVSFDQNISLHWISNDRLFAKTPL